VAKPVTVQVTDGTGRPVEGARVSFQVPPEGPGGVFSSGLRTDLAITDASGHATVRSLQFNRIAGPCLIRVTAAKEQARAGIILQQYINRAFSRAGQSVTGRPITRRAAAAVEVHTLGRDACGAAPAAEGHAAED